MIRMTIEIDQRKDGAVTLNVHADPFDPRKISGEVGPMWVGICLAINDYANANGLPEFNCLKASPTT